MILLLMIMMRKHLQLHRLVAVILWHTTIYHLNFFLHIQAWAPNYSSILRERRAATVTTLLISSSSKEDMVNSTSASDEEDWRYFRTKLVQSENKSISKTPKKDSNNNDNWAYDTGDFVERGSIVLSVPSSNSFLNDVDALNNICYRKSIVLVLDVSPNFIQGIVLNRPTNIGVSESMEFVQPGHNEVVENEMGLGSSSSEKWKVWFGGEVGGPYSDYPQVMCIHSIESDVAMAVSSTVLSGIYTTSFEGAQQIVNSGQAGPSDFWLFAGICGWETSSFYKEMHSEGLWHIVSVDSETVLEELNMLRCEEEEELAIEQNCDIDSDPRNAGLHTWEMLMERIGLEGEMINEGGGDDSFGDLMLHEWSTGLLSFSSIDEKTKTSSMIMDPVPMLDDETDEFDLSDYDPAAVMSKENLLSNSQQQSTDLVGVMVRASPAERSPFLLCDQGFHKSLILILHDGDDYTEGLLLNHVTDRAIQLDLGGQIIDLPIRYGGPAYYYFNDEDDDDSYERPTVFLHSSDALRSVGVGTPIGKSTISKCTREDVIDVIKLGLATVDDIMAIQGSSIWTKKGDSTGVLGDVEAGFFELVPTPTIVRQVWNTLMLQEPLSMDSLEANISKSRNAWILGSKEESTTKDESEKDKIKVFATNVDVTALAEEASKRWVAVNLLSQLE